MFSLGNWMSLHRDQLAMSVCLIPILAPYATWIITLVIHSVKQRPNYNS